MSDEAEQAAVEKLQAAGLVNYDPSRPIEWVIVSDDNGDRVEWGIGIEDEGYFIHAVTINLNANKTDAANQPLPPEHVEALVFERDNGIRWNSWTNYQFQQMLDSGKLREGNYYRIKCKSERKTRQGSMKVFDVWEARSLQKPEEPF